MGGVACAVLIVTGELDTSWPRASYAGLQFPAEYLSVEACSHWGLVLKRRALSQLIPMVSEWISRGES